MTKLLIIVFTLFSTMISAEESFLSNFVIGKYMLIGKAINSDETYLGSMTFYKENNKLKFKRKIKTIIYGNASIDKVIGGDTEVLKLQYTENLIKFEETCLVSGDLDNYARISCYLYQTDIKTDNPGMEVFFINNRI